MADLKVKLGDRVSEGAVILTLVTDAVAAQARPTPPPAPSPAAAEPSFDTRAICRTAIASITGRDLKSARVGVDQNNQPGVDFTLNPAGADKFKRENGRNVGRRLAIVLDGSPPSFPISDAVENLRVMEQIFAAG